MDTPLASSGDFSVSSRLEWGIKRIQGDAWGHTQGLGGYNPALACAAGRAEPSSVTAREGKGRGRGPPEKYFLASAVSLPV